MPSIWAAWVQACRPAVNHERATAERPALSHGCLAVLLGSHTWPGCRRHRGDSGPCTAPPATAGASSRADMARPAVGHMSTSSSGQDVALWPRQPRLKSWCGQQLTAVARHAVYQGGLGASCMPAVDHERATAERPALSHGVLAVRLWSHAGLGPGVTAGTQVSALHRQQQWVSAHGLIGHALSQATCPHRLVVRTSRCGRDNPGSNPGVDSS